MFKIRSKKKKKKIIFKEKKRNSHWTDCRKFVLHNEKLLTNDGWEVLTTYLFVYQCVHATNFDVIGKCLYKIHI